MEKIVLYKGIRLSASDKKVLLTYRGMVMNESLKPVLYPKEQGKISNIKFK